MLIDEVDKFVDTFSLNSIEPKKIEEGSKMITQSDIMNRINIEFQKPFIKNLYRNPGWKQRVFWAVAGHLQNAYDDLEVDVSLDKITTSINKYIENGIQDLNQRDIIKLIRDTIHNLQVNGTTKKSDVITQVSEAGITEDRFAEYIIQMKREGSVFEAKEGFYKCMG